MADTPYNTWDARKGLEVLRDIKPEYSYWLDLCYPAGVAQQVNSDDEYIDFEKIPAVGTCLAPFITPMGSGKPAYRSSVLASRFKPAYIRHKDVIDPMRPMTKLAGVDRVFDPTQKLSPMQRREILRASMAAQQVAQIRRRWEWMAAQSIINAQITIAYEDAEPVSLDFKRAAGHTEVLTSGNRWGDSGVSIFDYIQGVNDTMFDAPFGGPVTRVTLGTKAWKVYRKDPEVMEHMDLTRAGSAATVERGLIGSDRVQKVGELLVGGNSGSRIELYLYKDWYEDNAGSKVPFMAPESVVFTSSAQAIQGYRCFGAIADVAAGYQPFDIFPRNWVEDGEHILEWISHQSSPLFVPLNPNATYKATVVA